MHSHLINSISRYIPLNKDDKSIVENLFIEKTLGKGELFLQEGKICRELGFITQGLLCYYVSQGGSEMVHNFAKEGDFVCNYDSLIRKSPSQKNIMALEPTTLLVITSQDLQKLYTNLSNGEKFGRLLMESVYTDAIQQIISFYTGSPQQRYQEFLENQPGLVQRVPQYYIASYIGIKPQSLSRIRKRLLKA